MNPHSCCRSDFTQPRTIFIIIPVKVCPNVAAVDREPPRLRVDNGGGGRDGEVASIVDVGGAPADVTIARGIDDRVSVTTARDLVL